MSQETMRWLNSNTLIGYTDKRGSAWHYRAGLQSAGANHYRGPVPVQDVRRRLFGWEAESRDVYVRKPGTGTLDIAELAGPARRGRDGRLRPRGPGPAASGEPRRWDQPVVVQLFPDSTPAARKRPVTRTDLTGTRTAITRTVTSAAPARKRTETIRCRARITDARATDAEVHGGRIRTACDAPPSPHLDRHRSNGSAAAIPRDTQLTKER
jgi:hypothetical protein